MKISVVTPAYKCEKCIKFMYQRLIESLSAITDDFEIIFVNDASPENDWREIAELCNRDKRVKGINFSRNFGQHYAITAGLDYATGEWIIVMDCDLQDRPEEIPRFLEKAQEGYEVVLGQRVERQDSLVKKITSKYFYKTLSYLTDTYQDESVANFGIYHRKVIDVLISMRESLRYFPVMVRWAGFNIAAIEIGHDERTIGKTSYSFMKRIKLAINVMIAFSDKPLRLTAKIGLSISMLAIIYALFLYWRAITGNISIEGWASIVVSIWFLSGLIIFTLGMIGVYIGKIFDEVKKRPIYVERDVINCDKKA